VTVLQAATVRYSRGSYRLRCVRISAPGFGENNAKRAKHGRGIENAFRPFAVDSDSPPRSPVILHISGARLVAGEALTTKSQSRIIRVLLRYFDWDDARIPRPHMGTERKPVRAVGL